MARESFRPSSGDEDQKITINGGEEFPDEVEVDLDNNDPQAFEIVEEDDTPEDDRGRQTSYDPDPSLEDQIEDLRSHGGKKKVEARIKRLSFERETARRAKEEAQRQLNAAVEAARMAHLETEEMRRRVEMSGTVLAENMLSRNETAMREAKSRMKQAYDTGDTDSMAELQAVISKLATEELAIRQRMPRPEQQQQQQVYQQQPQQQQPQYAQPPQQAPQLAPNVAAWISQNKWFGQPGSESRTEFALSIHKALVGRGVDPSSSEYTRELDRGLKSVYNDHKPFVADSDADGYEDEDAVPKRAAKRPNANADAGRENGVTQKQDKRKVTLTRSELLIAKKLGVSPQAYAAQKLRMSGDRGAN